jgi:hypothetical protein
MGKQPLLGKIATFGILIPMFAVVLAVKSVWNFFASLGMGIYKAVKERSWTFLLEGAKGALHAINEVIRNALRAVPFVGIFVTKGFDMLETMGVDAANKVIDLVRNTKPAPSSSVSYQYYPYTYI